MHKFNLRSGRMFLWFVVAGLGFFACKEPIEPFRGFIKSELELLLSDTTFKTWQKVSKEIDGASVISNSCADTIFYTFHRPVDSLGEDNNLFFLNFNRTCDKATICEFNSELCALNEAVCADFPDACAVVPDTMLWLGYWRIPDPFLENGQIDSVQIFYENNVTDIFIENITSQFLQWRYFEDNGSSELREQFSRINTVTFDGIQKSEMEHLLSGLNSKTWRRTNLQLDEEQVKADTCSDDLFYTFHRPIDSLAMDKNLLLLSRTNECAESLVCCNNLDFCERNTTVCNEFPEFCNALPDSVFWVGYWQIPDPAPQTDADTIQLLYNNTTVPIAIKNISNTSFEWEYQTVVNGSSSTINEDFRLE